MVDQKLPQPPDPNDQPIEKIPAAPKVPSLDIKLPPKDELAQFYGNFAKMRTTSSSKLKAMRANINNKLSEIRKAEPSEPDLSRHKLISDPNADEDEITAPVMVVGSSVEIAGPPGSIFMHRRGKIMTIGQLGVELRLDDGRLILLDSLERLKLI